MDEWAPQVTPSLETRASRYTIRGGRVLDPGNAIDMVADILVDGDKIGAIEPPGVIPRSDSDIELPGSLVVPGLIDIHGHWYRGSPYGLDPAIALAGGVTTAVDAGTTGYGTFPEFRRTTALSSPVRVAAFLNVAAAGLPSSLVGELEDLRYARPYETTELIQANRDVIVGVKVRTGAQACGPNSRAALEAALTAAEAAHVPVMAHIAVGSDVVEVLGRLRSGDIVTHAFSSRGETILGPDGRVRPEVLRARDRGVLFDVGHGCASFSWRVAEAALASGLAPDTISTDLHRYSIGGSVGGLCTAMAKWVTLGLSLRDAVMATTASAAAAIERPATGGLAVGSRADITILTAAPGPQLLIDADGRQESCPEPLTALAATVDGNLTMCADVTWDVRPFVRADLDADCASAALQ